MERFVLLRHTMPDSSDRADHWDLMLQAGGVLRTWELTRLPGPWAAALGLADSGVESGSVAARALADHRLAYLEYEGPVSGGRGEVQREDGGELRWVELSENQAEVELQGGRLRGKVVLSAKSGSEWSLAAI